MVNNDELNDEIGNNHISTSINNPIRDDAFELSDDKKIELIKKNNNNV